jgi:hypothetical protein
MRNALATLVALCLPPLLAAAPDREEAAKGKKVKYERYNGYFEKNSSGLTGGSSYLVFTNRDAFDKVFGVARVIGKQKFLPKDAFEKQAVVAVIKRGKAITNYKVDGVTADKGTLTVRYGAKMEEPGTATFATPLILSVPKGKYKSVRFIENGKKAETVKVGM